MNTPTTNCLGQEASPYLRQHASNPVHWMPWGEDAFARARAEEKPIFLSIGYSTCHWCHVMAHESFEDDEVAALLNEHFVSIKVDREERPDVDRVYMTFVQATTGSGGWPMSVWLTQQLQPFYGGTYFPPDDRWGRPGFKAVLRALAKVWREDRNRVVSQGAHATQVLQQYSGHGASGDETPGEDAIWQALDGFRQSFDPAWGGFGDAPKFPRPVVLQFLWRAHALAVLRGNSSAAADARMMAETTLRKMIAGGVHDHLGGGFHRYSVDATWHVPHFEKMLYDQAQIAVVLIEAFQVTGDAVFARAARWIFEYVRRDLTMGGEANVVGAALAAVPMRGGNSETKGDGASTAPTGNAAGFFSAEDADSVKALGGDEHAEGAFYVWRVEEMRAILGEDSAMFFAHHGVEENGNAPDGSDPHGEFVGANILTERMTLEQTAAAAGLSVEETSRRLAACRAKLFAERERRPRPHRDEKILAAWNGLMMSACARGAIVFEDPALADMAGRAARFVRASMWDATTGILWRSVCAGRRGSEGFAEDYACVTQGALDLYAVTFDVQWLQWALELQNAQDRLFWDEGAGGYFSSSGRDASVLVRMKEDHDGAEPSPGSVSAFNLLRLGHMLADKSLEARAERTMRGSSDTWSSAPQGLPLMMAALADWLRAPRQVVIAGQPGADDFEALARAVRRRFRPGLVVLAVDGGDAQGWLAQRAPYLRDMRTVDGKAAAYVCENFSCRLPITEATQLGAALDGVAM